MYRTSPPVHLGSAEDSMKVIHGLYGWFLLFRCLKLYYALRKQDSDSNKL
jgi:hypothetical protein